MEEEKIKIELTPFDALEILRFFKSVEPMCDKPMYAAVIMAVREYELQLANNMTDDMMDNAEAERAVNQMFGACP